MSSAAPDQYQLLVVDDEVPHMKALCDTLSDQGYVTTGFTSAKEALAAMRGKKFDLLLTDLMMPEMDGITLLRSALEMDPNLVGIMMTGHGTISTAVEAMRAGALDYILKPFKLSEILPVLSRALSVRQLRLENAALQRRVAEHAASLEEANKELDAFAYSISHDLRAPLRAVEGFSKILLESHAADLAPDAQRLLNQVVAGAKRMGQLIDDLLRFSRLSRQQLREQVINVRALVEEVIPEVRAADNGENVELNIAELPETVGDYALLKQVFTNLLANAFKFTRKKPLRRIEVGCEIRENEQIYFVRDNGAGFDMEYAPKLFRVFQRLHGHHEFEGTGIGLSIVQRIVQRHGGRVWAEAEMEKGATFYFALPKKLGE